MAEAKEGNDNWIIMKSGKIVKATKENIKYRTKGESGAQLNKDT